MLSVLSDVVGELPKAAVVVVAVVPPLRGDNTTTRTADNKNLEASGWGW